MMTKTHTEATNENEVVAHATETVSESIDVSKLNLRAKLARCMGESERVEMRGTNTYHKYKYAKAGDVFAEARVPLAKYGIIVIPQEEEITDLDPRQTKNEGFMYCVRVKMRYVVMDSDSDEKIEIVSTGEGQDGGDKGIAKAKTFAAKYALQQLLLLPTGDDPEADDAGDADTKPVTNLATVACPKCGLVGALRKGLPQYGGGWYCNKKNDPVGCGANFAENPAEVIPDPPKPPSPPPAPSAVVSEQHRKALWASCKARAKQLGKEDAAAHSWLEQEMLNVGVPPGPDGHPTSGAMLTHQYQKLIAAVGTAEM